MSDAAPQHLDRELEQRVLALWSDLLGTGVAALDRDGLVVVHDRRRVAAGRRATLRTARGTLLLAGEADVAIASADPGAFAADVSARARAAGLFHYLDAAPTRAADPRVRELGAADRPLLDALQRAAGEAESEEAEVDVEHPLAVGVVEDGRMLAIASLYDEGKTAVDVGVLVHPAARGRGLGAAVVDEAARRAIESGRLVQYRCNVENMVSARLARGCGFALWGVLAVAPLPER